MTLTFEVENQMIHRTDTNIVVADSKNYLHASFTFSEEWQGTKTAIFSRGVDRYCVLLENDACLVPWEVIKQGSIGVTVFCGDLITANTVYVSVYKSGYGDGKVPSEPTPSVYQQILSMLGDAGEKTDSNIYKLKPNIFCLFITTVSTLTITLPETYNFYDEFKFAFTTSENGCNLLLPSNISWLYDTPTLEANKYYECSILNNKAVISQ